MLFSNICMKIMYLLIATLCCVGGSVAATLQVGVDKPYNTPCAALTVASPGDVIEIDAGLYKGDVCAFYADNLTIRGVNGRAHIDADGKYAQGKGIWVPKGNNTVIENIEFSGAKVPDRNGAGIRQDGRDLTVRNCYFHDNENGILGGVTGANIVIEFSEFARNGYGDGYSHNLYIGRIASLVFRFNYSHDAKVGHLLKTRAAVNYILYNRLTGESGTASYEINVPNGGTTYVIGNLVQQGPATQNSTILSYLEEGFHANNPGRDLYVVNNTFVNQRLAGGTFVRVDLRGTVPPVITNNIFFGKGTLTNRPDALLTTNFVADPLNPPYVDVKLVDVNNFDYHLAPDSPAIDAGTDPGTANELSLAPLYQYVHPASGEPRVAAGNIDIGAYEFPDTVPPVITINVPGQGATYLVGSAVMADCSCSDGTHAASGVAACVGPVASGSNLNTSTVGLKMFTVNASDVAGNTAEKTNSYNVHYGFKGLFDPYVAPPRAFKIGSSIPLKWQYADFAGAVVDSPGADPVIDIRLISTDTSEGEAILVEDPGSSGLRYDSLTKTWQFNWQTKGLAPGIYNIPIISGQTGQTDGPFPIQLR